MNHMHILWLSITMVTPAGSASYHRFIKKARIPYDSKIINKEVELWVKQTCRVPGSLNDGNLESPIAYQLDGDSDHPSSTIK